MGELTLLERPRESVFWSAPAPDSEFAPEDPLALDYLAQQIGLFLLPTLTTRSSRAQAFAVVLYGLDLAHRGVAHYGHPDDDDIRRQMFERWERFWALSVLEHHAGRLSRGDLDAMRGIRGAVRAWFPGTKPLPLDYPLISRQQELGSLGAYLSPLRLAGLVIPGTLRPGPAAAEIIAAFWHEPDEGSHSRYEAYALEALDLRASRIERKQHGITLAKVGEQSRQSSLVARRRGPQQQRLYSRLVETVFDKTATTQPMFSLVERAAKDGADDARQILVNAARGRWTRLDDSLVDLLDTAVAFGDVMDVLLRWFDRAYVALDLAGWRARRSDIARSAMDATTLRELKAACGALLSAPQVSRLQRLPMHGPAFVALLTDLRDADLDGALVRLLAYHHSIQRERRRGDAWIRQRDGELELLLTTYTARPDRIRFPGFKLGVVRQLLQDLGRVTMPTRLTEDEP